MDVRIDWPTRLGNMVGNIEEASTMQKTAYIVESLVNTPIILEARTHTWTARNLSKDCQLYSCELDITFHLLFHQAPPSQCCRPNIKRQKLHANALTMSMQWNGYHVYNLCRPWLAA